MKSQLNKELIEGLNESNNQEFLENVNKTVFNLISAALEEISQKSPFVNIDKCVMQPVDEIYTGAISQLSEYNYYLGINNPQIEFNSKMKKNFWKNLWREFKSAWRLGKKKYKKRKKEQKTSYVTDKYKLSDFRHDLVNKLADFLSESSIVYEYKNHISIIGIDDFGTGVKINVYICCYEASSKTFKRYDERKNKFFLINFGDRFSNIDYKIDTCGTRFVDMIRIFNALYAKSYDRIPNQIMIESLLFNCPNLLFNKNDVNKTFVDVANFIRLADPHSFGSICDLSKSVFKDELVTRTSSQLDYGKIITMLNKFQY